MSFNTSPFNSFAFNATDDVAPGGPLFTGEGSLVEFAQTVTTTFVGSLVIFDQTVELRTTGSGSLVVFDQTVVNTISGSLIKFGQLVQDVTEVAYLDKNGFDAWVYIDGVPVPRHQLTDDCVVNKVRGDAQTASFSLFPPRGPINLGYYEGKLVQIDVQTYGEGLRRIYTGRVSLVELDIMNRRLRLTCSDNRREQVNTQLISSMPYIGYWSENIFGVANELADQLDSRLQTIPYTLDFDSYGVAKFAPLYSAALPDYTFVASTVYRDSGRDPKIRRTPRAKVVNTIKISYEYRYQRMFHAQRSWTFRAPYHNNTCDFLRQGYSVPQRSVIESAIQSAGWPVRGEISYLPILKAGWYNCSLTDASSIGWFTTKDQTISVPLTTSTINPTGGEGGGVGVVIKPVLDAAGNQIYTSVPVASEDLSLDLCFGADWQATYRWAQNVTEQFAVTVSSPGGVAKYGPVIEELSAGIDSQYESSEWESYNSYLPPPSGVTTIPAQPAANYYWNEQGNFGTYAQDMKVLINKAYTSLIKAHSDNHVEFQTSVRPGIELYHTVEVDASAHTAQVIKITGRVYSIQHVLNFGQAGVAGTAYTKLDLTFSVSDDAVLPNTPFNLPTRPVDIPTVSGPGFSLTGHYGLPPNPAWTGHIGNKNIIELLDYTSNGVRAYNHTKTKYPESFVVDTPAIPDANRANKMLPATASYNVYVPNDNVELVV